MIARSAVGQRREAVNLAEPGPTCNWSHVLLYILCKHPLSNCREGVQPIWGGVQITTRSSVEINKTRDQLQKEEKLKLVFIRAVGQQREVVYLAEPGPTSNCKHGGGEGGGGRGAHHPHHSFIRSPHPFHPLHPIPSNPSAPSTLQLHPIDTIHTATPSTTCHDIVELGRIKSGSHDDLYRFGRIS